MFIVILVGCTSTKTKDSELSLNEVVENYIKVYQARSDFERFLAFYSDDVVLEDMLYGYKTTTKQQLGDFFNWNAEQVHVLDSNKTFSVEQTIISQEQGTAVLRGTFNLFSYNGQQLGPWRFTTVLKFNDAGLIYYQQDWINYYPRSFVLEAPNLNTDK
ncbi:nuclear transport factor 2 family protein [Pseudoalteromonas luteoviolacea]|nr:nuclear transport factor 2 family protein [Pseudoalteromonas luteoviolacea]